MNIIIPHSKPVQSWLIACMCMVVIMVFVGGVTRLTESGLSIVEWKLFSGIFPPLSSAGWDQAFTDYQSSPEFKIKNADFTVTEFKQIFWLEYLHRLFGRVTGMVLLLPFAFFLVRKKLSTPLIKRMVLACVLVALQGTVGWIMVKSGLEQDPRVNPIKLALHLSLAFTLFSVLLWTYFQVRGVNRNVVASPRIALATRFVAALVIIQIILGALVAGLDAGMIYNTYPLMDGKFIPHGLMTLDPWYYNIAANVTFVQFTHRMGALVVTLSVIFLVIAGLRKTEPLAHGAFAFVGSVLILQFLLGVATLIYVVPITLASAHQMVALLLLAGFVHLVYRLPVRQTDAKLIKIKST